MHKTVVINAVALTPTLLGPHTPSLNRLASNCNPARITPTLPAVTCSAQTTYLTGATPAEHGIVGNGWYFRDTCEIRFWHQSNKLVQRPLIWDIARQHDRDFTCANICWWYAMYSGADFTVTPRPMYPADGRKIPDLWTNPSDLRETLQSELGQFPLFKFWGPMTSIDSTRWIVDAAMMVDSIHDPTLTLIYLPHLDYSFQRYGPSDPRCTEDVADLDKQIGRLIDWYAEDRVNIIVLSEYGITPVSRPVHINRILRKLNLLRIREEMGRELLDPGSSQAFAVADHQIAHVYVNDPTVLPLVVRKLKDAPGIAHVYSGDSRKIIDLDHPRAGEVIAVAEPDAWFTYYYWNEDSRAPDFARTVDIHRKPGYDPVELFIDPKLRLPQLKIATKLMKRKLGFRTLLDVISLDATLVKGSHGRNSDAGDSGPMLLTTRPELLDRDHLLATDIFDVIMGHLCSEMSGK